MNIFYFVACLLVLLAATYTDIKSGKIYNESFYPILLISLSVPFVAGVWEFLLRLALVVLLFFVYEGFIGGGDAKLIMMLIMLSGVMKTCVAAAVGTIGVMIYSFIQDPEATKNSIMSGWIALKTFTPSTVKGKGNTVIFAPFLTLGFVVATLIYGI